MAPVTSCNSLYLLLTPNKLVPQASALISYGIGLYPYSPVSTVQTAAGAKFPKKGAQERDDGGGQVGCLFC